MSYEAARTILCKTKTKLFKFYVTNEKVFEGIYFNQLKEIFELETGLYLSL